MMSGLWQLLLLGAVGLPPALALRRTVVAAPLAPLLGALSAAVAGSCELLIGGGLTSWWVLIALLSWLPSGLVFARRGGGAPGLSARREAAALLGGSAGLAYPLSALKDIDLGPDAVSIWQLHARWFYGGHDVLVRSLPQPAYQFSHAGYPPLVPVSTALGWLMEGRVDPRSAQVLAAGLSACAVLVAVAALGHLLRGPGPAVVVGSAVAVVALYGVADQYATQGLADLLTAAALVGAVLWGLVLSPGEAPVALAVVLASIAATTKNEGVTTAGVVVAIVLVRQVRRRPLPVLVAIGIAASVVCLLWPIAARVRHATTDFVLLGSTTQSIASRLSVASGGVGRYLGVPLAAVAVSLLLTRVAAGSGRGQWWPAATVAAVNLAVLLTVYVAGTVEIHYWILSSVDRTTGFVRMLACVSLVVSGTRALAVTLGRDPERRISARG